MQALHRSERLHGRRPILLDMSSTEKMTRISLGYTKGKYCLVAF